MTLLPHIEGRDSTSPQEVPSHRPVLLNSLHGLLAAYRDLGRETGYPESIPFLFFIKSSQYICILSFLHTFLSQMPPHAGLEKTQGIRVHLQMEKESGPGIPSKAGIGASSPACQPRAPKQPSLSSAPEVIVNTTS